MRRAIQVTGHRRAVPLLPEQAHASPFRLSHPALVSPAGLEPANHPLRMHWRKSFVIDKRDQLSEYDDE